MEDWQVKEFTLTAVLLLSERTDDDSWQGCPVRELYLYPGPPNTAWKLAAGGIACLCSA
jgi:hypothetical protein